MPREARKKDSEGIYHVMARSISEFDLYQCDDDKEYYLNLLERYKEKFNCKVYGYCLMTNHVHMHIDPCGYDISKFMHCLNLAYVRYINIKYKRKGHLFSERFQSKIIKDMNYNLLVSAYIHNNPGDIPEYKGREYEYPYSSMGFYTGKMKDKRNLIDTEFILSCINESNKKEAKKQYVEFVGERKDPGVNAKLKKYVEDFDNIKYTQNYERKVYLRDVKPDKVIEFVADKFKIKDPMVVMRKWERGAVEFRATLAYILNVLCGLTYSKICDIMHNITEACCANLCKKGFEIVKRGDFKKNFTANWFSWRSEMTIKLFYNLSDGVLEFIKEYL